MTPLPPVHAPALAPVATLRAVGGIATGARNEPSGGRGMERGAASAPTLALLLRQAGDAAFPGQAVDVVTFHDAESGHDVCRVTDRDTGAVLAQMPPDELLRLYVGARDAAALAEAET